MKLPTLYSRTSTGAVQTWTIEIENGSYRTEHGQLDGKIQTTEWTVCKGKNLGKANETSPQDQALKEANAAWKKKIKEKYKQDPSQIDDEGFFEPQLAKGFEDYKDELVYPVAVEDKLNGIRCIFSRKGAFSRKGEEFFCLDHIKEELEGFFQKYPNAVLDGELFNPLYKNELSKISSLVSVNRKEKDITEQDLVNAKDIVQYHIYDGFGFDCVTQDSPYLQRRNNLTRELDSFPELKSVKSVATDIVTSYDQIVEMMRDVVKQQREGLMIKELAAPYVNKRTKAMLKLKSFMDEEFEFLYFMEGTGNWSGKVKKAVCKLNTPATNGETTFKSNVRGSMPELEKLWNEREQHENKGKKLTVTFQEYSVYGIPLIPYCDVIFRDYE
jgi:DNA ligase 1